MIQIDDVHYVSSLSAVISGLNQVQVAGRAGVIPSESSESQ